MSFRLEVNWGGIGIIVDNGTLFGHKTGKWREGIGGEYARGKFGLECGSSFHEVIKSVIERYLAVLRYY